MMERFKLMSADEQKQFIDRMKSRGMDTSAFEKQAASATAAPPPSGRGTPAAKASAPAAPQAETIDALFGPLPPVESVGRAWMYVNRELKPVRLRLGITDGNNTEVLGGDLQPGTEVVTGMLVSGTTQTRTQGAGNPLMPQRGGPPRGR